MEIKKDKNRRFQSVLDGASNPVDQSQENRDLETRFQESEGADVR